MDRIRALIVDDEPLSRGRIRALLAEEAEIEVVGEPASAREAVATWRHQSPSLLFVDLQLSDIGDLAALEQHVNGSTPAIVFITGHDGIVLRMLERHSLDYLLRPFDRSTFFRVLANAKVRLRQHAADAAGCRALALVRDLGACRRPLERIPIRTSGRVFFLPAREVDWIDNVGNYARLHVGEHAHLLRERLKDLERRLDPTQFLRIHRSTIVNVDRIRELAHARREYAVVLRDGTRLASGRSYSDRVRELLGRPS